MGDRTQRRIETAPTSSLELRQVQALERIAMALERMWATQIEIVARATPNDQQEEF